MPYDLLIKRIVEDTRPGDPPFTTQDAMKRWGFGKVHTREALNRMTAKYAGATIRKDTDGVPYLWFRVEGCANDARKEAVRPFSAAEAPTNDRDLSESGKGADAKQPC